MRLKGFLIVALLTLHQLSCITNPIVDVDVSIAGNSFVYVAGRDSEGQEYRCVVNESADGLVWMYNSVNESNPLNAYQFYGRNNELISYTIECYSGSIKQGDMVLTLRDDVKFTVEYSGYVRTFVRTDGLTQEVRIPENTQNIVFTCEVSRGLLFTPIGTILPTRNPSITLTQLTEDIGGGTYQCQRFISASFIVLQLEILIGESPTPTTITSDTTTKAITTSPQTTMTTTATTSPTTATTTTTTPTNTPTPSTTPSTTTTTTITTTTTTTPTTTATTTTTPTTITTTNPETATSSTLSTPPPVTTTSPPPLPPTTESKTIVTTPTSSPPTSSLDNVPPTSISPPNTSTLTTTSPNVTMVPTSAIVIGFSIIGMILLILLLAGAAIAVCLWRHYAGFKNQKYLKHLDDTDKNGTVLSERIGSPKMFHSMSGATYEPLTTNFNEDNTHSQPIHMDSFKSHMDRLWESDCLLLNSEYNALGLSELRYSTEAAREHISDGKNRYKNIYPYDKSRVHLQLHTNTSDYINASYIPSVSIPQLFIACQAPKRETMLEWWEMLWQKQISNVVMLTRVMEGNKKKCEPYFPERVGETIAVGDIYITLLQISSDYNQTSRLLGVKSGRDVTIELMIRHFHFSGWPDHEAPQFPHGLITFIKKVKRDMLADGTPICCHCSAGVGRTGAFIALYNLIEDVRGSRPISVFRIVNEMREHRPHMVQTFTQYKFIYLACLELIHGDTAMPTASYSRYYKSCVEAKSTILQNQLEEIDYFSEKSFTRSSSEALNPRHASFNPDPSVLPYDDYRPVVSLGEWGVGEYINASYVDGFQGFQDLIATQHPNAYTARSTIQLIHQTECPLVVVLASPDEYSEMGYEHGRIVYWPEPNTQHEFEGFILKNMSTVQLEIMEYVLLNTIEKTQHQFHLIISLHWDATGAVTDQTSVIGIVNEMISVKANFPTKPILVQCRDGAGKTGVLISLYNAITQATQEQRVDVFQTVKCLRYCRPKLVSNLVQYKSIHSVLNQHLAVNTYVNLSGCN